jgi:hypothetical protein
MKLTDDLVVLDTETTGKTLDHDVWEIAYAIGEGPVRVSTVPHSIINADPQALELNGYHVRHKACWGDVDLPIRMALLGRTIVGANPSFDAYRLEKRWGHAPWHYRTIDVESMALPVLQLVKPLGLKGLVDRLTDMGYDIPSNDHTAAGDVLATREVYRALMDISGERIKNESTG